MPRLTGAQFLADSLHAQGVTHVFFVPADPQSHAGGAGQADAHPAAS